MEFTFTSEVIEWRGPAPFYFIPTPAKHTAEFKSIASQKSYGWGVLYANIRIGNEYWKTFDAERWGIFDSNQKSYPLGSRTRRR